MTLRKLDKRFPGTHALKAVDLDFMHGEIHAIVGENGAGKSTLIKTLTGAYARTSGEIVWEGKRVALASAQEAIELGINAVQQEMVLCPHLTVAANMFLGHEDAWLSLINDHSMERKAQRVLDELGFSLRAREARRSAHRSAAARSRGARRDSRRKVDDLR